jgi:hypothetical protein
MFITLIDEGLQRRITNSTDLESVCLDFVSKLETKVTA